MSNKSELHVAARSVAASLFCPLWLMVWLDAVMGVAKRWAATFHSHPFLDDSRDERDILIMLPAGRMCHEVGDVT